MDHLTGTGRKLWSGVLRLLLLAGLGCTTNPTWPADGKAADLSRADDLKTTDLSLLDASPGDGADGSAGDGGMCKANGQSCLSNQDCCSDNCILRLHPGVCCVQGGCP